ncbi:MAG: ABC transporter [OM182 bacterium MED-G24]|uniref:ABC transporter n=1 Tax=OM182 bacterium MED-G24 TaxID=1986255 RepID=A0A2A5WYZ5_9GAMM|nr:MAG: ABC transporter [OM182 bacterium MED-G24]|tara:strand:+ start:2040 stop:3890 length:1851 start_codon:yes stop_codon:yes gene_type:complete
MNEKLIYSGAGLVLIAVAFVMFILISNTLFSGVRFDLTENNLYTLSDGTHEIIDNIDEPINLYFFFSEQASADLTSLRSYATRVRELLEEYEARGGGNILLSVVDPEPFSDAEDQAAGFGLQSVPVDNAGDDLYFGLAGTNSIDGQEVIAFFQPDKEEFLEYEISKLIQTLSLVERPTVGLLSSMMVQGDFNMQTMQQTSPWVVVGQIEQTFDVETVPGTTTEIPSHIETLILIHPKELTEDALFAIDQFAMRGGRILAFVDPVAEMDAQAPGSNPMTQIQSQASDLGPLLPEWGAELLPNTVLGDSQSALTVGGQGGQPIRHLAILGFNADNLATDDVITGNLESLNFASVGIIEPAAESETTFTPLIHSSEYAAPLQSFQLMLGGPEELQQGFSPTGERYVVAARLSGNANSAYLDRASVEGGLTETSALNVLLVADTDFLSDRLWVQVRNFFGTQIASPFADNGDFFNNAVENMTGSSALISVRSRGRFTRPFDVVQDLRREAEASYLASANDLQDQLAETETKLQALQSERTGQSVLSLSTEQEAELIRFQDEKLRIRKELRDIRHQLDKNIESLGATLKFTNVILLPIMLTLILMLAWRVWQSRSAELEVG